MGNQIIKVHQSTAMKQQQQSHLATSVSPHTTIASTNTGTVVVSSSSGNLLNHQTGKTVILNSSGQAIRLQGQQIQQQHNSTNKGAITTTSPQVSKFCLKMKLL